MKKVLFLIPLLALSITGCDLLMPQDSNTSHKPKSSSEEVIDSTIYGSGDREDEVLSVGYDIPAGEYWVTATGNNTWSGYSVYGPKGYNPSADYENRLFSFSVFEGEHYLTRLKFGQFILLSYVTLQNSKVDQGLTTIKNGMFKVGEQIKPIEGMVRVKVCEKPEQRLITKPNFTVYTYDEDTGDFSYDALDSKTVGIFENDDTQYHMIENPPVGSYIQLVGLEVAQ